jgi:NRAMP (natural resistance-associated macrophage protein)-like metal ion transporter
MAKTEEITTIQAAETAKAGKRFTRARFLALLAVLGPGLLAGLADDDPAGITTYSQLGAGYGYQLLWVLTISTAALILFQQLGARIGVVTGQGLVGLIRQKFGARSALLAIVALVIANIGTMAAEFAGIAAGFQLFGVSKYISVPLAGLLVSFLVLKGGFRNVERILLVLSAVFICYVIAGFQTHTDWLAAAQGALIPTIPASKDAILIATATLGTTLAPWGLSFIQSYVVDKRLTVSDMKYLRVDVWVGALLTGIIGFFVVVTCASTLHVQGITVISDAAQAAAALQPLAGNLATVLFAVGLIGAALLAASILPLSTAYSVADLTGQPAGLDDKIKEAPLFYGTFGLVTIVGMVIVLIPGAPLVPILVLSQVVNAILLLPLLIFMHGIARDKKLMGEYRSKGTMSTVYIVAIAIIAFSILALAYFSFF